MEIKRCYDTLIGASVAENQLCNGESVTVPNGRKYYLKKSGVESLGASEGTAITGLTSGSDMVIDLTQMLGSAIADYVYQLEQATTGSGITWLRSYGFLKGYQAYNAGSIESVEATGKKVVGKNQFNPNVDYAFISCYNANGESQQRMGTMIRLPSGDYTITTRKTGDTGAFIYCNKVSHDGDFLFFEYLATGNNGSVRHISFAEGDYLLIFDQQATTATAPVRFDNYQIQIERGTESTEYEAYTSQTYALGSDVLRGIFKLDANNKLYADGDVKSADGTVTRNIVHLTLDGTEDNWFEYPSAETELCYLRDIFNNAIPKYLLQNGWGICDKLICAINVLSDGTAPGSMSNSTANNGKNLYIKFPSGITSLTAFKTWLGSNPIHLDYIVNTPTTETSTPFTSPQVCYPGGTEEFVTENGVPVGHETKYQL